MGLEMTPESLVGAFALADRFALMLRSLSGRPLPPLPAVPGRVHRLPEPNSVEADAEDIAAAQVWRELVADTEGGSHD